MPLREKELIKTYTLEFYKSKHLSTVFQWIEIYLDLYLLTYLCISLPSY